MHLIPDFRILMSLLLSRVNVSSDSILSSENLVETRFNIEFFVVIHLQTNRRDTAQLRQGLWLVMSIRLKQTYIV